MDVQLHAPWVLANLCDLILPCLALPCLALPCLILLGRHSDADSDGRRLNHLLEGHLFQLLHLRFCLRWNALWGTRVRLFWAVVRGGNDSGGRANARGFHDGRLPTWRRARLNGDGDDSGGPANAGPSAGRHHRGHAVPSDASGRHGQQFRWQVQHGLRPYNLLRDYARDSDGNRHCKCHCDRRTGLLLFRLFWMF